MARAIRQQRLELDEADSSEVREGAKPEPSWERRRSYRVELTARASLWQRGELRGSYSVSDLSMGGCAVSDGPQRALGEVFDVMLHVPHRVPLAIPARVQRVNGKSMGLAFEKRTSRAEDWIQDVVVDAIAKVREYGRHVALVIEPRDKERLSLVRTLQELGQRAIGVATALDAVQLLVEEGERVDTAFVEAESDTLKSQELIEYLANHHPHVRRILVGEPENIQANWVVEATGEVHALLETPCDREVLRKLISRISSVPISSPMS